MLDQVPSDVLAEHSKICCLVGDDGEGGHDADARLTRYCAPVKVLKFLILLALFCWNSSWLLRAVLSFLCHLSLNREGTSVFKCLTP